MKTFRRIVSIGGSLGALMVAGALSAQTTQELFETVTSPPGVAATFSSEQAVRSRTVAIDLEQLQGIISPDQPAAELGELQLNFFADSNYTVQVNRTEAIDDGAHAVFGTIENLELGNCTLIVDADGKVTGNCSSPQGMYQVRYLADGIHVLHEIDQAQFPDELDPIPVNASGSPATEADGADPDPLVDGQVHPDEAQADDDGTLVDMLVAYTPAAGNASSNIVGEIQLAVAETNQAYANSGVSHRVRLVGTRLVNYTESGFLCNNGGVDDLARLRGTTDGFMDNLHSVRNSVGADQVTLIVESGGGCGCAYIMNTVSSGFDSSAFGVVKRSCATGNYSFGHELGHNMGARHDCYVDNTLTPYAHAHGYVHLSNTASQRWRTIMAYNDQCEDNGYNCTRIQYFSNPSVNYLGAPTGTSGSGCRANNRQTHVNTDLTVSRFRDGYCYISGIIERVFAYDDSVSANNYVYVRPYATASYYQYFRTRDDNIVTNAARAARKHADVTIRGQQSCYNNAYDYGGDINYLIVNP